MVPAVLLQGSRCGAVRVPTPRRSKSVFVSQVARSFIPDWISDDPALKPKFKEIRRGLRSALRSGESKRRKYTSSSSQSLEARCGGSARRRPGFDVRFRAYGKLRTDFINDLLGRLRVVRRAVPASQVRRRLRLLRRLSREEGIPWLRLARGTPPSASNLDAEATINLSFAEAFKRL